MADAAVTGQGDVAGRLVETAADALGAFGLYDEDERRAANAVLAAVLPLLADEVAANAAPAIRSAADLTRADADSYAAAAARGLARGQQVADALLRDLAVRVAR